VRHNANSHGGGVAGDIVLPFYVMIEEIDADARGYDGLTQTARKAAGG